LYLGRKEVEAKSVKVALFIRILISIHNIQLTEIEEKTLQKFEEKENLDLIHESFRKLKI